MAVTRLPLDHLRRRSRRAVEVSDLRAAFSRVARARWGVHPPVDVRGASRGTLQLTASSVPWRSELLSSVVDLCDALKRELPELGELKGIAVFLR